MSGRGELAVAVLGHGAIGSVVAYALHTGQVPGAGLAAVVDPCPPPPPLPAASLDQAIDRADLVVECAGQDALRTAGRAVVAAGRDLLAVSTGALADAALHRDLLAGPGRLRLCAGAIGGLDVLAAAARAEAFDRVTIRTTKAPDALLRPWMDEDQVARLRAAAAPVEVMRGFAREVTRAFPATSNVAASVALAVGDWDVVEAVVVADPAASVSRHEIEARGPAGRYRFEVANRPSPDNPRTSGVVPHAVLRAVEVLAGATGRFA
ncbi:aspartate dehydrogenase domain-containing protein [Spirillospora sp. NPDC048819]|uniref:aspartate dehydrogenase domain-containing protein n=1 Tax=Spirillospora sp. NPDC048819 TaxID=3155268 RepID=UPI0033EAFA64